MRLGTLALRGIVGPLFVGHGLQKLRGWFGGHGLDGTAQFFESLDLRPGRRHAMAAGTAETVGGALLTAGALTPVGSALLSSSMVTAIRKVHGENGIWSTNGGYEYNLVLIGAFTALADLGPGRPSVDAARLPWMHGRAWAAASLAAGVLGSYLATSERFAGAAEQEGATDVPGGPAAADEGPRFVREEAAQPSSAAAPASSSE